MARGQADVSSDGSDAPPHDVASAAAAAASSPSAPAPLHRWLAWAQFRGAAFCGWQRQGELRSVAAVLENAWVTWHGEEIGLRAASRTDAGVHARALPFVVATARQLPTKALVLGWNERLPSDVAVVDARPVDESFHVRHDAIGKRYIYRLWNARARSPARADDHWHVPAHLDLAAMARAAALLAGDHDFAAFRSAHCQAPTTRRTLRGVDLRPIDGPAPFGGGHGAIELVVEGNAFLHNMVRILAGTLVAVGRGQRHESDVTAALASGDRRLAGQTAPAHGLELMEVMYGPSGARQGLDHKLLLARMEAAMDAPPAAGSAESSPTR